MMLLKCSREKGEGSEFWNLLSCGHLGKAKGLSWACPQCPGRVPSVLGVSPMSWHLPLQDPDLEAKRKAELAKIKKKNKECREKVQQTLERKKQLQLKRKLQKRMERRKRKMEKEKEEQ